MPTGENAVKRSLQVGTRQHRARGVWPERRGVEPRGVGCRGARGGAAAGGAAPVASAHFRESRAPWPPPARSCQLAGAAEPVSAQARPLLGVCAARSTVRHHGGIGEAAARRDLGGPGLRQGHRVVAHHQTLRAEAPLQRGPAPPEHAAGHRWELRPRAGSVRSSRRGFAGRGRGSCEAGAALPTSPGERASGLLG